jgi:hypothetical protein
MRCVLAMYHDAHTSVIAPLMIRSYETASTNEEKAMTYTRASLETIPHSLVYL